ncbi:hypothetical protein BD311DRAFT_769859 [Dichomitus squalens]|uniref:Uncharacterized protein n=1 Tax=Dichomitus squalens TaxID=114155 RepID=A0A4Q9M6Y2_9APHY|nr:hypothetical protein BD311DRAFT_769859 [Dichomitus squalens]
MVQERVVASYQGGTRARMGDMYSTRGHAESREGMIENGFDGSRPRGGRRISSPSPQHVCQSLQSRRVHEGRYGMTIMALSAVMCVKETRQYILLSIH